MAIGRSYPYDNKIQDTDLFLGTKSSNLTTVNYTAQAVADYLNTQGKISIGGQMVFKFVTVNPLAGTISFPALGGNNTPFSAITNLIVSVADLSTQNVVNFISYIVGSEILLTEQNQISTFGNYKITAYAITANPNFYDLTVEYIGGYGNIVENTYYDLSFFREPVSAPVITPNLNSVLLEGNTSLLDAKIGSLYLYDTTVTNYAHVDITDNIFTVRLASDNPLFQNEIGFSRVWNSIGVEGIINYSSLTGGRIYNMPDASGTIALTSDIPIGGLTSVGLSMPAAFNVSNSPLTSDGTIAVSAAGTSSQYIRGDGQLATLPSSGGGGSSINYYLNGSISASVAGYKQLGNTAIVGAGTDFPLTGNGLITQFLTDIGNPNRIQIPGGAWNFEMWFSMSSNGGTPKFYVELLKYDGSIFTSIASTITVPESITGGTNIDLYLTSLAVPTTTLLSTDRLAVRVYIVDNSGGRTVTLHTEDNHLCEVLTTFSGGVTSLNGLTANTQYFAVGTTGTDFNISSVSETHTFNLPTASATNRGALSTTDWTAFNGKFNLPSLTSGSVLFSDGTTIAQKNSKFFWDNTNNRLGIGTNAPTAIVHIKAPGALSTDIALRVRNSADTFDIIRANGAGDVFIGLEAGGSSTGAQCTFNGAYAGRKNTTGSTNSAFGYGALRDNISGSNSSAFGFNSLVFNLQRDNSAFGESSLFSNTNGLENVGFGKNSGYNNILGIRNVFIGVDSGRYIVDGSTVNSSTNNSIFIGRDTRANANSQTNQIVIGDQAIGAGSNTATLGNTSVVDTVLRGRVNIQQYATASRPTYVKGALIYDSTLSKLVIGGASGWEVVTSI